MYHDGVAYHRERISNKVHHNVGAGDGKQRTKRLDPGAAYIKM